MDMIVQSFPGLTELGLAGLEMEALPEGVISKRVAFALTRIGSLGIGNCVALRKLDLYDCRSLTSLPEGEW